jgi:hypothetical protein
VTGEREEALRGFTQAWNGGDASDILYTLKYFFVYRAMQRRHTTEWSSDIFGIS